jgi:hypothetical protein
MGGGGVAEMRARAQSMPVPWSKERLPMQAESPQGVAVESQSAFAEGQSPGPDIGSMPPGQAGAPEPRRPRTHQQGPSVIDMMRAGGSKMAVPEAVPSLHADVATTMITASASSVVLETGTSLPQAVPTPPGNPLTNVSTNPAGKLGGLSVDPQSPRTGLGVKAGTTVAKPRTPFNPAIYGKKS